MNKILLSIGSNMGNKFENINNAVKKIKLYSKLINSSFLYKTKPMYNTN